MRLDLNTDITATRGDKICRLRVLSGSTIRKTNKSKNKTIYEYKNKSKLTKYFSNTNIKQAYAKIMNITRMKNFKPQILQRNLQKAAHFRECILLVICISAKACE